VKKIVCFFCLLSVVVFAGCATQPLVRSDHDPDADFGRFKTYGFFDKLGTDEAYATLLTKYLKEAVSREMERREYRFSKEPDLQVNFHAKVKEKQRVVRSPGYGYYGYRWGYYGPWGGYAYDTYVEEYSEGTLNIDLVDRSDMQMVWEGVAIGRVTEKDFQNLKQVVDEAVTAIFEKYPYRAGQSEPVSGQGASAR
jgi:Domain of unknown function (DUF4136)